MVRQIAAAALVAVFLCAPEASAQQWAQKMFKETSHDFGDVARGAKAEFEFELTNLYKEDIHIASVRASCKCTEPSIVKPFLKTWEKGAIKCRFNTNAFLGQRGATVTVTIDKPFFAEVQLQVKGYIRSDVIMEPGAVEFGEIDLGGAGERKLNVTFAGRENWKIEDIRSANDNLEVELGDAKRGAGRVVYQMVVRLKPGAPEGSFQDELHIVTDDANRKQIPLSVSGKVVTAVDCPRAFLVGMVKQNETVTKPFMIKGKRPFRVTDIECAHAGFSFKKSDESRSLQVVQVTFQAGADAGEVSQLIKFKTDLNLNVETLATVNVQSPDEVVQAQASGTTVTTISSP